MVLDWAAGFVVDADCADTLASDRVRQCPVARVPAYRRPPGRPPRGGLSADSSRPPQALGPLGSGRPTATRCGRSRELEIEAASLFERVDNALKLIGDHYLSRVFDLASTRFHLRGWQQSIRRKLETVGDVYDLLDSAGRRPAHGGPGDHRRLADRPGDHPGSLAALSPCFTTMWPFGFSWASTWFS